MKSMMIESDALAILPKGRYEITGVLGVGAYGRVYVGIDLMRDVRVVLKLSYLQSKEAHARIEREVDLFRKLLPSVHIVSLLETFFSADGSAAVLVMEYVDGATLQTLVDGNKGSLPDTVTAAIARQLCDGLALLHSKDIVHRDIKPANVLLGGDGIVKICDFGIAVSRTEVTRSITTAGTFVGTLRYAAPEQWAGPTYSVAADIYALGVTILFMVLGRQPYEDVSLPYLLNQLREGALLKELPHEQKSRWGPILESTLLADPARRPTAKQLQLNLREAFPSDVSDAGTVSRFLAGRGGNMPPPSPPVALSAGSESDDSLRGSVKTLAARIAEVQAAVADMTVALKRREFVSGATEVGAASVLPVEEKVQATFAGVRRRLEFSWRLSMVMTFTLFSVFVVMTVLAVVIGVIYQKSAWALVFGGASATSVLTVLLWKPMDKMFFATIATQQLELIQLNYHRALTGTKRERQEAFRDVSAQLNALMQKVSTKHPK